MSARLDRLSAGALILHLALALSLRTIAWPEVTTPAYLWSRGLMPYRDIKFLHAPGLMALLGAAFALLGTRLLVVRGFPIVFALLAHGALLAETRLLRIEARILASAFFLVLFYGWQGNSIWPSVILGALAIPISRSLVSGRVQMAAGLVGMAILFKQTAAAVLFLVVVRLLWQRRFGEALLAFWWASVPYLAVLAVFAASGAGDAFLRWTLFVPFQVRQSISVPPPWGMAWSLFTVFLPIVIVAMFEKPMRWHLTVGAGFALMALPRFGFLQILGAVPCLALGVGRLLEKARGAVRWLAFAYVAVLVASAGAIILWGEPFNGRVLFWNDDPAFNRLIGYLRQLPVQTRLYADVWGNVLPRSGLLPAGGVYVHPWLARDFGLGDIDSAGQRIEAAARQRGVVRVEMGSRGCLIGPYSVTRVGSSLDCPVGARRGPP